MARFVECDDRAENRRAIVGDRRGHGRPLAVYTDHAGHLGRWLSKKEERTDTIIPPTLISSRNCDDPFAHPIIFPRLSQRQALPRLGGRAAATASRVLHFLALPAPLERPVRRGHILGHPDQLDVSEDPCLASPDVRTPARCRDTEPRQVSISSSLGSTGSPSLHYRHSPSRNTSTIRGSLRPSTRSSRIASAGMPSRTIFCTACTISSRPP